MGFFSAMILENLHLNAQGVILAKMRRKLDFAMYNVVVFDETADESDYDDRRHRGRLGPGGNRRWNGAV